MIITKFFDDDEVFQILIIYNHINKKDCERMNKLHESFKEKKIILLRAKNYDVFIKYKILYKKRKSEQETSVRDYIHFYLS